MAMCSNLSVIFVILLEVIWGVSAGGDTLVLLDNLAIRETHSMFFKSLQGWLCVMKLNINHAGSMSIRGSELAVSMKYVVVLN